MNRKEELEYERQRHQEEAEEELQEFDEKWEELAAKGKNVPHPKVINPSVTLIVNSIFAGIFSSDRVAWSLGDVLHQNDMKNRAANGHLYYSELNKVKDVHRDTLSYASSVNIVDNLIAPFYKLGKIIVSKIKL